MATLPSSSSGVTMTGKSTRAAAPSSVPYPENDARVAAVRPVFCSNALLSALSLPAEPTTCVTFVFTMLPVEISRVSYVWFKRSFATVVPACATRKDTAYVPSVYATPAEVSPPKGTNETLTDSAAYMRVVLSHFSPTRTSTATSKTYPAIVGRMLIVLCSSRIILRSKVKSAPSSTRSFPNASRV